MLDDVAQAQKERLFHIDFRAWFLGSVSRKNLIARFGIKEAAATRDIALYRQLAPGNLLFDSSAKIYRCAPAFSPLFRHDPARTLTAIAEGIGDDAAGEIGPHVRAEHPLRLNQPRIEVIAAVSSAIASRGVLRITYFSLSSGRSEREIVPHALVDTGARWHVRAFDRLRTRFSDFVLTRIDSPQPVAGQPDSSEEREADEQWMRIVRMELVPHPGLDRPEAIARDYGMGEGGTGGGGGADGAIAAGLIGQPVLQVRLRAAVCGYALLHWSVDATADHSLDPARHHLWLRNRAALYGVENLAIAPGAEPHPESGAVP